MQDKREDILKSKHKKEEGKKPRQQDLKYGNTEISQLFFKTYSALEKFEKNPVFQTVGSCKIKVNQVQILPASYPNPA